MYQSTTIIGDLGKDAEMRYTPKGTAVTNFSVATSNKYQKDGEWITETTWFRVSVWGKMAEACNQYLAKGSRVMVEGRVKAHAYLKGDGTPDATLEINAQNVKFLDKRNGNNDNSKKTPDVGRYENYDDVDIPGFMQD